MFHYLQSYKKQQQRKQNAKTAFIAIASSLITGVFAAFFSQKQNRDKVVEYTKKASKNLQESAKQASTQIQDQTQVLKTKGKKIIKKLKNEADKRVNKKKASPILTETTRED